SGGRTRPPAKLISQPAAWRDQPALRGDSASHAAGGAGRGEAAARPPPAPGEGEGAQDHSRRDQVQTSSLAPYRSFPPATPRTIRAGRSRAGLGVGSAVLSSGSHLFLPDLLELPPLSGGPVVEMSLLTPGPGRSGVGLRPGRGRRALGHGVVAGETA